MNRIKILLGVCLLLLFTLAIRHDDAEPVTPASPQGEIESGTERQPLPAPNPGTPAMEADAAKDTGVRRTMLTWHQATGLATWALWLATNLEGERAIQSYRRENEIFAQFILLQNPGENYPMYNYLLRTAEWESPNAGAHRSLATATWGMYALSAGLALFAPSRFEETPQEGFDSVFFHKSLAWVHFAAMAALPVLASRMEHGGPEAAHAMGQAGWAGFTAFSISIGVFYF